MIIDPLSALTLVGCLLLLWAGAIGCFYLVTQIGLSKASSADLVTKMVRWSVVVVLSIGAGCVPAALDVFMGG